MNYHVIQLYEFDMGEYENRLTPEERELGNRMEKWGEQLASQSIEEFRSLGVGDERI